MPKSKYIVSAPGRATTMIDISLSCGKKYSGNTIHTRKLQTMHQKICKVCRDSDTNTSHRFMETIKQRAKHNNTDNTNTH